MSRLHHTLRRAGAGVVAVRTARTHPQRPVRVEVARVVDLTPSMRRITFTGPELAGFPVLGNDHYARLLLPRGGKLVLPKTERWYPELLAMDRALRPWLRNYTLRHIRPDAGEVDVDFVLHGGGPAALWAADAGAGDVAGLIEQGAPFTPAGTPLLVVADESGIPAALSILEGVPDTVAVLEVESSVDEIPCTAKILWLHRASGERAVDRVPQLDLPVGQAWLAGEAGLATGLRRHLVRDRGFAKSDVTFTGYYRTGRPQYS